MFNVLSYMLTFSLLFMSSYLRALFVFDRCFILKLVAARLGPAGPFFFFSGVGGADSKVLSFDVSVLRSPSDDVPSDDGRLRLEHTDSVSICSFVIPLSWSLVFFSAVCFKSSSSEVFAVILAGWVAFLVGYLWHVALLSRLPSRAFS